MRGLNRVGGRASRIAGWSITQTGSKEGRASSLVGLFFSFPRHLASAVALLVPVVPTTPDWSTYNDATQAQGSYNYLGGYPCMGS